MATNKANARLKVFFAPNVGKAVILRRGPSKQVCTIGWDFNNDSFQMGQWLKGTIDGTRCDLSPDGKHFIYEAGKYFLSQHDFKYYTVVSRAPFLKALKIWQEHEGWSFGGAFLDNRQFWVNESEIKIYQLPNFKTIEAALEVEKAKALQSNVWLFLNWRRKRDGWQEEHFPEQSTTAWTKQIKDWKLSKTIFLNSRHKERSNHSWIMRCEKTGESFDTTNWEWADLHEKRLLFAHEGKIFAVRMWESGHGPITLLCDFNDMVFEPLAAPY